MVTISKELYPILAVKLREKTTSALIGSIGDALNTWQEACQKSGRDRDYCIKCCLSARDHIRSNDALRSRVDVDTFLGRHNSPVQWNKSGALMARRLY